VAGQPVTLTLSTSSAAAGGFSPLGGFRGPAGTGTGTGTGSTGTSGGGTSNAATANGVVFDVAKVASASSGVATYPVTVLFTSDANDFYIGSTVTAAITTDTRENVLQVPTLALTTVGGSSAVTVAIDGTKSGHTETVPVKTGLSANGMVEITAGLKEGQKVVVTVPAASGNPGGGSSPTGSPTGRGTFPSGGQFGSPGQ
jgi:multidrug efflux pump subunit AcrA (membrane-fusion protein)